MRAKPQTLHIIPAGPSLAVLQKISPILRLECMLRRLAGPLRQAFSSSKVTQRPMDEVVKRAIQITETKKRHSVPWKFDDPWKQLMHIYSSDQDQWQPFDPTKDADIPTPSTTSIVPARLSLHAWNIDFMLPFPDSRMLTAIRHLESLVQENEESTASVIYLQECVESDLGLLASDRWIQRTFALSDTGIENWQSGHYGTCTLIDRRLPIKDCFRVHYSQTRMERDGLFVDVLLGKSSKVVRLCNTHLESLAFEPPYRPPQMKLCAKYMPQSFSPWRGGRGGFQRNTAVRQTSPLRQ